MGGMEPFGHPAFVSADVSQLHCGAVSRCPLGPAGLTDSAGARFLLCPALVVQWQALVCGRFHILLSMLLYVLGAWFFVLWALAKSITDGCSQVTAGLKKHAHNTR